MLLCYQATLAVACPCQKQGINSTYYTSTNQPPNAPRAFAPARQDFPTSPTEPPLFLRPIFSSQTAYSNHLSAKRRPAFAPARQGFSYFCLALYFVLFTYLKFCNSHFKNSAAKRHPAFAPAPRGFYYSRPFIALCPSLPVPLALKGGKFCGITADVPRTGSACPKAQRT